VEQAESAFSRQLELPASTPFKNAVWIS